MMPENRVHVVMLSSSHHAACSLSSCRGVAAVIIASCSLFTQSGILQHPASGQGGQGPPTSCTEGFMSLEVTRKVMSG